MKPLDTSYKCLHCQKFWSGYHRFARPGLPIRDATGQCGENRCRLAGHLPESFPRWRNKLQLFFPALLRHRAGALTVAGPIVAGPGFIHRQPVRLSAPRPDGCSLCHPDVQQSHHLDPRQHQYAPCRPIEHNQPIGSIFPATVLAGGLATLVSWSRPFQWGSGEV